jgi:thioredoxin reductase
MTYADKRFPEDVPVFPHRSHVLNYLRDYGSDIRHLVSFNHEVVRVEKNAGRWVIKFKDYSSKDVVEESFDAVAVASGHYDLPLIPAIRDLHLFPSNKVTHSKYYRRPSDYCGKAVLLIGNSASGIDIGNQLAPYAATVFRSIRSEMRRYFWSHPRITDVPTIDRFTSKSIILTNGRLAILKYYTHGRELDVDAVIFCTGYLYTFPFLGREYGFIREHENYIHNLYDQTFYVDDPSLVFLGMPRQIMPFPTFQNQAILVTKVWAKKFTLPDTETLRRYEPDRLQKLNYDHDKYHSFPHPEDIELGERWRQWIEADKSDGWELCMKPWEWTAERVKYKESSRELRSIFQADLYTGKLD